MAIRLFRHYLHLPLMLLMAGEAAVFAAALCLATMMVLGPDPERLTGSVPLWARCLLYAFINVGAFTAMGLYSTRQRAGTLGIGVRIVSGLSAGALAAALMFYVFPETYLGRGVAMSAVGLSLAGVVLLRILFNRLVNQDLFKRRVLVLGAGERVKSILMLRRRSDQRGFLILGFIPLEGDKVSMPPERLLDMSGGLPALVESLDVDEIVVAMDDRRREFPLQDLLQCRLNGVEVTDLLNFLERETGKVKLDVMNPSWFIFSEGFRRNTLGLFTKRAGDLLAASLLLLISWPLMLAIYLALKIGEGWDKPAVYSQERVGLDGRVFVIRKFRSMSVDAEADGKAQWATSNDSRVTTLGAFLRKTRLDELPQLFNVLAGDMSFVGPRPERPEFVQRLNERIPYYRERHCVKPGLTGWAQLCYPYGSSEQDAMEKLQYDMYYVKNQGLVFDLAIVLQTVEVVLWGKGAR